MENKMENKKILLPSILAVITLIVLVVSATYAYFAVETTNNFGTSTINASAESVGTPSLVGGNNLILEVSAVDMMNQANNVNYFATTTGEITTTQAEAPIIGTASVTGNGTFNCSYTLNIAASSTGTSMLTRLKAMTSPKPTTGQLILTVNGTNYDLYSQNVPITYNGTFTGLTAGSGNEQYIRAQLKLVNLHGENGNLVSQSQNDLANTDVTLTFTITAFTCTAV